MKDSKVKVKLIFILMMASMVTADSDQGVKEGSDQMMSSETVEDAADQSAKKASEGLEAVSLFDKFFADDKVKLMTSSQQKEESEKLRDAQNETGKKCRADIYSVIAAANMRYKWALEMVDATGKTGSGLLRGNALYLGDFDECLAVKTGHDFESRYCTTRLLLSQTENANFSQPVGFMLGLCMPSSCNSTEVEEFINEYLQSRQDIVVTATYTNCQERELPLSSTAELVIYVCITFAIVVAVATVYDVLERGKNSSISKSQTLKDETVNGPSKRQEKDANTPKNETKSGLGRQFLLSFSLYTNTSNLLSTDHNSIECIHAIKFWNNAWVILLHTVVVAMPVMNNVKPYLEEANRTWIFQLAANSLVNVDSFFVTSGLLNAYLTLKKLSNAKGVTLSFFGNYYFHRFWRLTPPYMLILMTHVILFKYLSNGPLWPQGGVERYGCEGTWWNNLFYINNLRPAEDICMPWSWYLAADMQFYVFSPIVFLALLYYDWMGLVVPMALLVFNAVWSYSVSYAYNFPPTVKLESLGSDPTLGDYLYNYYNMPHTRMGPYLVGMVAGFFLYKTRRQPRMSKLVVFVGWLIATVIGLGIVFGLRDHISGNTWSNEASAMYNALHRIGWGLCLSWVIIACDSGYGGIINTVLSWKAWVPLSRLSYCAYLLHPGVAFWFYFSQRQPMYMNHITMICAYIAIVVLTYVVSFVAHMAYEAPMMGLEKVIRDQGSKHLKKA